MFSVKYELLAETFLSVWVRENVSTVRCGLRLKKQLSIHHRIQHRTNRIKHSDTGNKLVAWYKNNERSNERGRKVVCEYSGSGQF
jgi:hypothetical protein